MSKSSDQDLRKYSWGPAALRLFRKNRRREYAEWVLEGPWWMRPFLILFSCEMLNRDR